MVEERAARLLPGPAGKLGCNMEKRHFSGEARVDVAAEWMPEAT